MEQYFSDNHVAFMKKNFCNLDLFGKNIEKLVANEIFGREQSELIAQRYEDMRNNFDKYTQDYARTKDEQWQFSEGLHPYFNPELGREYMDTTAVVMPVTHPDFKEIFNGSYGSIGVDLPTWFNIKDDNKGRIMLIAQDPLRSKWYGRLTDKAVVSSPFGLQDRVHRNSFKGGRRFHILVSKLVGANYGVYLTDCRKFFVKDHSTSDTFYKLKKDNYIKILRKEIELVDPTRIVAFGNCAYGNCCEMFPEKDRYRLMGKIPHLSGSAHKYVVDYINGHYHRDPSRRYGVDDSAEAVADIIIEGMQKV